MNGVSDWKTQCTMGAFYSTLKSSVFPAAYITPLLQGPSWSSINYGGAWKLLHHRAARFFAPLLVSAALNRTAGTVSVHITSDITADVLGVTLITQGANYKSPRLSMMTVL